MLKLRRRRQHDTAAEPVEQVTAAPTNGQRKAPRKLLEHAFTPENAAEAARRSHEVRRAKNEAKRERSEQVARVLDTLDRAQLGPYALQAALMLA